MFFDVIVIGGGHAGIEASLASARRGANTLLITTLQDDIGELSCNPSFGGPGKSQLISEIYVLGGALPHIADNAAIHTRLLNSSRGVATQALRVQVDRELYAKHMKMYLQNYKNLTIYYEKVKKLDLINKIVNDYKAKSIVLTTGTFLCGLIHRGKDKINSGRLHRKNFYQENTTEISKELKCNNILLKRFKTGTPARLYKNSINFNVCEEQKTDKNRLYFTYNHNTDNNYISCYITKTNDITHKIIKENINQAPMYNGDIIGTGPRYCPSIEDKIIRFQNHPFHHVFLEPEGLNSDTIYPNGISTSFGIDIQDAFIRTIKGLENVKVKSYGYAIEYDVIDSLKLKQTLEHKDLNGIFFAGQINGTSGYEEAASQGIVAGANAASFALNLNPLILNRTNSIIGVLIDDITNLGIDEPYRMFTSRCEYRLYIRSDNAIIRLGELSKSLNLITNEEFDKIYNFKKNEIKENDKLYEGYININKKEIERVKQNLNIKIPKDFNYNNISGLTNELKEKINYMRPDNFEQLSRIQGMTPACLVIILHKLKH